MLSRAAAKAYVAAGVAALGSLAPVAGDGASLAELLTALGVALAAFQAVYWTSNGDEYQGEHRDDDEPAP